MTIAFVQQAAADSTGAGTTTATLPSAPGAGATLVAFVGAKYWASGTHEITGITGGGVTWFKAQGHAGSQNYTGELWYGFNSSGSGTSIVASHNSYNAHQLCVAEFSGLTAAALETQNGNSGRSNSLAAGSVTPTASVERLLFAGVLYGATITGNPSGWTNLTAGTYGRAAYRIESSTTGSYSATWTGNDNYSFWGAAIAVFDPAGGGGGGGGQVPPISRGLVIL